MEITNIIELQMEAYMLEDGEIITRPITGNEKFPFKKKDLTKVYNYNGSTLVFYNETSEAFVVPIPKNTVDLFEKILQENGYKKAEISVPLSNGFDYPELKDKWEAVKGRIKLIA